MADLPIPELGGQTPLAYAKTPHLDRLAAGARIGMVQTIPEGMKPGSDTANLAVLGYDPKKYYTGRSPLEALSIGVPMKDTDIALRCNLVTLTEEEPYEKKRMSDHSSSEISTEDAHILIEAVKEAFADETWSFYTGTSYRHLTIWHGGKVVDLTPPHDILEQQIGDYLPGEEVLRRMMEKSFAILNHHPLNEERAAKGLNKANSIWFLFDRKQGRPVRAGEAEIQAYRTGVREKLDMEYAPRRIELPQDYETAGTILVARHHIDTNHHVNNAQYVELAREVLPEEIRVKELRAEYKKAAVLGDMVCPRVTADGDSYTVALCSEKGSPYAVIWMRTAG